MCVDDKYGKEEVDRKKRDATKSGRFQGKQNRC